MTGTAGRLAAVPALLLLPLALGLAGPGGAVGNGGALPSALGPLPDDGSSGCVVCHEGIEDMHPAAELSCVDCHGGDATARKKMAAHVRRPTSLPEDERVPALEENLGWRRFVNPMDLRVVDGTCGTCHERLVDHLVTSLHGSTAGHLSDGYYEMGLFDERGSQYSVFPIPRAHEEGGEVESLVQVPAYKDHLPENELATHFTDLVRKECMQCHLYSEGRAVQGRVGFDGDYRGDGCAACHVEYAPDGLSDTADPTTPRAEPGHPRRHTMTRAPSTSTCTSCHYGDASIGLHFRGLSQLPPGAPGGPDIPGTTDAPLNRAFYLDDPSIVPPDIHHEKGMHCVDCHTQSDVMGDGRLHGQMEHAVEISCEACHGTFDRRATLRTERGTPLAHVKDSQGVVTLTSKVDGKQHVVPQVVEVLDPGHARYNAKAAAAMNAAHGDVECYTCHAGWNVNFLGFHFSRNESLTQLDLISGRRTPGRVTTQEKVFSTWKSFYAGLNETGSVAPYMTGFSTMGSVWDEEGELTLDQVMPVTSKGLSGLTMVHHQVHATRPTARSCVECHRTSSTWGMGSPNFRLGRQLAFVGDRRGLEVVGLNRSQITASPPLGKIVLPDIVDLVVDCDDLQGHAQHVYVTEGGRGIHVVDVSDPTAPRRVAFLATVNPRNLYLGGDHLYLADGIGGLKIYDVSEPEEIHEVGRLPMFDAHDVQVQWPYAYVADGPGGLAIVDVRAPIAPRFVTAVDLNGVSRAENEAILVRTLFQYSRPVAADGMTLDLRTDARHLAAVIDRNEGLRLVDVTEATRPEVLFPPLDDRSRSQSREGLTFRGLALLSQVDLAEAQGGEPTRERDYAYVLIENRGRNGQSRSSTLLYDVTDPSRIGRPRAGVEGGYATEGLTVAQLYNPPFLQRYLFSPGELGVFVAEATVSKEPQQAGILPGLIEAYAIGLEEFPLDRMIDESGRRLKDVSRDESRWLYRAEVERILDVPGEVLGTIQPGMEPRDAPGITARLHLANLDADGSGMLEQEEIEEAGGAMDANGDGRISLAELAGVARAFADPASAGPERVEPEYLETRVDENGDLARLLDGTDPFDFDKDRDGRLSRRETERAVFAALDLDGDERVTWAELSRHPGSMRRIRYGDWEAELLAKRVDTNRDGKVTSREFKLRDEEWEALDADGDGGVQLPLRVLEEERDRGSGRIVVTANVEWPYRRAVSYPLPPMVTIDAILAAFDADEDERLTQRELKSRPDLMQTMDTDLDGILTREEIGRVVNVIARLGVDAVADDFVTRWDLDGSGEVEDDEIPSPGPLRSRGILGSDR